MTGRTLVGGPRHPAEGAAGADANPGASAGPGARRVRTRAAGRSMVRAVYGAECRKLTAQMSTRALVLVCLLGPLAFALVLRLQNGLPADTLFGVWVHQSGYAVSLVVLGFAGSWGFPVVAGVLAGDLFAGEDRHGTWKTILARSATRRDIFLGKVAAAGVIAVMLLALTAVSSLIAGLLSAGSHPLVGLSGAELPSRRALELVLAAWGSSILPTVGFVALAALFSMVTRNGIAGALAPIVVALAMQLLDLMGNGTWVHAALLGSAFEDWHGLFVAHAYLQPLLVGSAVSVAWVVATLWLAWRALRGRDFAGEAASRAGWRRPTAMVLGAAAALAVLAAATGLGPATITPTRLQASLAPAFRQLTLMQQQMLGRQPRTGARLRVMPKCLRRGGNASGPGDDWTCTLSVFIPQRGVEPFRDMPVTYDMSVQSDGCYKADAPPAFVGEQTMRGPHGAELLNPLYTIYGCFETDG